jgi:hypothetical protein
MFLMLIAEVGGREVKLGTLYPPFGAVNPTRCSDPKYPFLTEYTFVPDRLGEWQMYWCEGAGSVASWCSTPRPIYIVSSVAPPVSVPGFVTSLSVQASAKWKGRLQVDWEPPASTGGDSNITYEYRAAGGAWKKTRVPGPVLVKGSSGKKLIVEVRAVNSAGAGPVNSTQGVPR